MEKIQCQIVEYAPVLITTCNRYNHLKKSIDALKKCKHAENTELYISVDYPPSDSYVEGYNKNIEYLSNKIDGFKEVFIIYHNENVGVFENSEFLIDLVRSKGYNYFIFLEDDLVVKPAFLDFMNKCFEYFKYDKNVVGVHASGGNLISQTHGCNTIYAHYGACQGWFTEKRNVVKERVNNNYLLDILLDKNKRRKLKSISKQVFSHCVTVALALDPKLRNKDGTVALIDYCCTIYNLMEGRYSIASLQSLIENNGLDGSGIHSGCGVNELQFGYYEENEIDIAVLERDVCFREETMLYDREKVDIKYYVKCCICVFVLSRFGEKIARKVWFMMEFVSRVRPRFSDR